VGSALGEGLTKTRAGKINDRENLFAMALKDRLSAEGMPAWLVRDGLSCSNRRRGSGLEL